MLGRVCMERVVREGTLQSQLKIDSNSIIVQSTLIIPLPPLELLCPSVVLSMCPLNISWTAQPFFTRFGMVLYYHKAMSHGEKWGGGGSILLCKVTDLVWLIADMFFPGDAAQVQDGGATGIIPHQASSANHQIPTLAQRPPHLLWGTHRRNQGEISTCLGCSLLIALSCGQMYIF